MPRAPIDIYIERLSLQLQMIIHEGEFRLLSRKLKDLDEELYWIKFINYCHTGR